MSNFDLDEKLKSYIFDQQMDELNIESYVLNLVKKEDEECSLMDLIENSLQNFWFKTAFGILGLSAFCFNFINFALNSLIPQLQTL